MLLIPSFFSFVSITRSEFEFCFLFFVVEGAVTFLKNSMFALVWLVVLVISAHGFEFGVSLWRIWMAITGGIFGKIHDCVCRSGTLK